HWMSKAQRVAPSSKLRVAGCSGASGVKNLVSRTRRADGLRSRACATSRVTHSSSITPGTMGLPGKCPRNTGCPAGTLRVRTTTSAITQVSTAEGGDDVGHAAARLAHEMQRIAVTVVRETPHADREFCHEQRADQ